MLAGRHEVFRGELPVPVPYFSSTHGIVGDLAGRVEWDIEVDSGGLTDVSILCFVVHASLSSPNEDPLALEVDIIDGELVGERLHETPET